jgi:hypothetical protein
MPTHAATDRTTFTTDELLADGDYEAPLVANGVRCHGGFDADGRYRSPRTLHRTPAIEAWQRALRDAGEDLVTIDPALMPPQYPNVDQAVLLCRAGVSEPIVRALTIVSVVEGFGAIIRDVKVPPLEEHLVEPVAGTALAHLGQGLFEAHARDEAGYRDQGGHKQMWEAARDLAFENPKIPPDVLMRLMGGGRKRPKRERPFPQIDEKLERMLVTMANVLIVEIFAAEIFEWGKRILAHPDVSAEPLRAPEMVAHIQADETPHVEYLRAALSEVAARTIRTVDGGTIAGRDVVHGLLHGMLRQTIKARPEEQREEARASLREALVHARNPDDLLEEFEALETVWTPPARTGFEAVEAR